MTYLNLTYSTEPCFISDVPLSNDLPTPRHRARRASSASLSVLWYFSWHDNGE